MRLRLTLPVALLMILVGSLSALAQDAPPRYKLEVGREIQYQSVAEYRALRPTTRPTSTTREQATQTIWVIGRNEDGSSHLVVDNASKSTETSSGHEDSMSESEYLFFCDVFPDGRVASEKASTAFTALAGRLDFPRLPRDRAQLTWRAEYPDERIDFTMLPAQPTMKELVFRYEDHSLDNEIYAVTRAYTVHFDLERGLIVAGTSEVTQDYGFHSKVTTSWRLQSVETKDPAFTQQLAREAQVYSQAVDDYNQAEKSAERSGVRADAIMKQAGDDLRRARSGVTAPMFTAQLDKMLSKHERFVAKFSKEEAQHIAALVGKPAADWTLKDLTGRSHSLSDYRGKVVLLDFWYRGCGWCVQAMPALEKVADDFKNDPVVVLGMNSDPDEKDARFVADKLHLNYATTLLGSEMPAKFGVRAFPTFILIDPAGTVRDVRAGYTPHLREELDQTIRELLPAKHGSPAP